jgi:starch synthase (maltosyl-transferring)
VFADGHEADLCALLYKKEGEPEWTEAPMEPLVNDRWQGSFKVQELGRYLYTVSAWIDHFGSWSHALAKRIEANQDITVDLLIGAEMIAAAGKHAPPKEAAWHEIYAESVRAGGPNGIARALRRSWPA